MARDDGPVPRGLPEKLLAPFEWSLIEICWRLGEAPLLKDVHRALRESRAINYNSVNSILKRVEEKGWLTFDRSLARRHRCIPCFDRRRALETQLDLVLRGLTYLGPGFLDVLAQRVRLAKLTAGQRDNRSETPNRSSLEGMADGEAQSLGVEPAAPGADAAGRGADAPWPW